MIVRRVGALLLMTTVVVAACDDDEDNGMQPQTQETLTLSLNGYSELLNGYHYEGWAIVGGSAVSTGKFNVDGTGQIVDLAGAAIGGGAFATGTDLTNATEIVITIEPDGDTDAVPADTHISAGAVTGGTASLTVGSASALGDDFTTSTGSYILATPTDDPDANDLSGVWFLDNSSGSAVAGLSLPTLPTGWNYEGWAVIGGVPVSTGTFTAVDAADAAAPFSGPNAGPPFPGEDFVANAPTGLTFPTDLTGETIVISVEPSPDDDAAPFVLKPLLGTVPDPAATGTVYTLDNNAAATNPTGTATIS